MSMIIHLCKVQMLKNVPKPIGYSIKAIFFKSKNTS